MPRPRQSWSRHPRLLQPPWMLPTPTRHGTQGFESATRYHAMEDVMRHVVENQMGHSAASDRDGGEVHRCTSGGSV